METIGNYHYNPSASAINIVNQYIRKVAHKTAHTIRAFAAGVGVFCRGEGRRKDCPAGTNVGISTYIGKPASVEVEAGTAERGGFFDAE